LNSPKAKKQRKIEDRKKKKEIDQTEEAFSKIQEQLDGYILKLKQAELKANDISQGPIGSDLSLLLQTVSFLKHRNELDHPHNAPQVSSYKSSL
jgi:hypothetical protein